jgi:multidrug efflux pump subunit AcrB
VYRAQGASEVSVQEETEATIARVLEAHPGVSIDLVVDNVYSTYGNYHAAIETLIEGPSSPSSWCSCS